MRRNPNAKIRAFSKVKAKFKTLTTLLYPAGSGFYLSWALARNKNLTHPENVIMNAIR